MLYYETFQTEEQALMSEVYFVSFVSQNNNCEHSAFIFCFSIYCSKNDLKNLDILYHYRLCLQNRFKCMQDKDSLKFKEFCVNESTK